MDTGKLLTFLNTSQLTENPSLDLVYELIERFGFDGSLDFAGFCGFMGSVESNCVSSSVDLGEEDMALPLTSYFVKTSSMKGM